MTHSPLKLLNIGCGRHYHSDWLNIDVVSHDENVVPRDLKQGLPGVADFYDMTYHSHVLEHLTPEQGRDLLSECFRVLKPGGVLRIVVPDLEQIATLYLEKLNEVAAGAKTAARANTAAGSANQPRLEPSDPALLAYQWMTMELIDQISRHDSGGLMGPWMQQADGQLKAFIDSRMGQESVYAQSVAANGQDASRPVRVAPPGTQWRWRWAKRCVKWLLGKPAVGWLEVGRFRESGEVHRWMYDRVSLQVLCESIGFRDFAIVDAWESRLPGFSNYQLDAVNNAVRKPDSLFAECRKPE